jgi:hypothetical protein
MLPKGGRQRAKGARLGERERRRDSESFESEKIRKI